jgi:hypothetical protein
VPTRSLLPGTGITALGLTLLLVPTPVLISSQVSGSVHQFGPIGVTFALASWLLALRSRSLIGVRASLLQGAGSAHDARECEPSTAQLDASTRRRVQC